MSNKNYGSITEQGDLGLGFFAMNESEAANYEEHEKQRKSDDCEEADEKE